MGRKEKVAGGNTAASASKRTYKKSSGIQNVEDVIVVDSKENDCEKMKLGRGVSNFIINLYIFGCIFCFVPFDFLSNKDSVNMYKVISTFLC